MHPLELVDINLDTQTRRQRLRRRLWRVIIPIGAVILIVASITTIAALIYRNNKRDALVLSEDLLEALDRRIHSAVSAYLTPASNLVRIAAEVSRQYIDEVWSPSRRPIGLQVIKTYPQLSSFFGADPRGNFVMHKQNPDGTIDTKVIEREPSNVKVTWVRRNTDDQVVATEISGDDGYDPRTRPWYQKALQTHSLYWSDVYIFFTDQEPGITVSYPMYSQDGQLMAVVAIDIKLAEISKFLANLKIGRNGRAMIIEDNGTLVAYPEMDRMVRRSGDTMQTVMLDELDDPVLTRAFNRFKIDGHGKRTLQVGDRRYLNTVTSLKASVGRDWSVMIIVPEEDFIGFLRDDLHEVYLMTGIVIFISGSLAALMVYQGLRADRNALLVLERKEEIEAQSRAFSELASKTALWAPDDTESFEGLTEIVSAAMAVRRTSVWGYHKDEKVLRCGDSFDRETSGHTRGTELSAEDYPQLFEDLVQGKDIIIADTAADSRTSELHRVYLEPLGCASLLAIPVMSDGKLAGSIWFEHEETIRAWNTENLSFAGAVAGMLALRLSTTGETYGIADQDKSRGPAADLTEHKPAADSAATKSVPLKTNTGQSALPQPAGELPKGRGQKISFAERLLKRGLDQSSVKADVFEDVTVLVLRFTDPFALAEYFGGDHATTAVDHLICQFEDLFDAYRIDYWKILSDQIICATGLADHSNQHAHATADLALSLQDKCSQLFADLDKPMEYKIGIDLGGIMGSPVGRRRKSYNIWGEAVIAASMMADQSVTGGIQVSETTYRHLQRNYLFKVRGRYFLPNIGEISTYLLTGRL